MGYVWFIIRARIIWIHDSYASQIKLIWLSQLKIGDILFKTKKTIITFTFLKVDVLILLKVDFNLIFSILLETFFLYVPFFFYQIFPLSSNSDIQIFLQVFVICKYSKSQYSNNMSSMDGEVSENYDWIKVTMATRSRFEN